MSNILSARIVQAFLVAPLAPPLTAAIIATMGTSDIVSFPIAFLIYALVAYPCVTLLGVPAYIIMKKQGALSMLQITGAGALLGIISGVILSFILTAGLDVNYNLKAGDSDALLRFLAFPYYGVLTAWVFWFIGIRPQSKISKNA